MGLTKFVLKRPVTTILSVICLIVFGLSSVLSSKLELIPEMNMPMMLVRPPPMWEPARRTSANW